jgi:hypothetical protein
VKYARAIAHAAAMSHHIARTVAPASGPAPATGTRGARPHEIEISVDETDSPTSSLEHLFFGLELRRRGVTVVSLAPRFVGEFEKGIDYRGDSARFEASLREHVAIAQFCGPYKISVHSGSDKFSAYPIIGRVCGELLHVKTAGTSYLEALRVVARTAPKLFAEIAAYCRGRFDTDRKSYHISTTTRQIDALPVFTNPENEALYLDEVVGRQLLHVTFGSVLTAGVDSQGRRFKEGVLEQLERHADLHHEILEKHFTKHLSLLNQG